MDTKKLLGHGSLQFITFLAFTCRKWAHGDLEIFQKNVVIFLFNFCFSAIFSYLSRFYFWALGVPLLVGPWGLGLGLGLGLCLGSGYGVSIPMDCTGGPLQDALVGPPVYRKRTYKMTLVRMSVRPAVLNTFSHKTALTIFLKFGMKLGIQKCRKVNETDF